MKNKRNIRIDIENFTSEEAVLDFLMNIDNVLEEIRYRQISFKKGYGKLLSKLTSDN